jgi:hypothetical protein
LLVHPSAHCDQQKPERVDNSRHLEPALSQASAPSFWTLRHLAATTSAPGKGLQNATAARSYDGIGSSPGTSADPEGCKRIGNNAVPPPWG